MTVSISIRSKNRIYAVPLAWYLQDTNLFTGTVMENIRYGNLEASDEECIEAAKLSRMQMILSRRLPDGYDTMLTGNGANLFTGTATAFIDRPCSSSRSAGYDPG